MSTLNMTIKSIYAPMRQFYGEWNKSIIAEERSFARGKEGLRKVNPNELKGPILITLINHPLEIVIKWETILRW